MAHRAEQEVAHRAEQDDSPPSCFIFSTQRGSGASVPLSLGRTLVELAVTSVTCSSCEQGGPRDAVNSSHERKDGHEHVRGRDAAAGRGERSCEQLLDPIRKLADPFAN